FAWVIRIVLVAFVSGTNKSKTEIAAPSVPGRLPRLALFGPPPLIEGEDAAAYDQLLARICAAVKPVDVIDEMFTADVVSLEWEVLRLRRLKWSLIRARGLGALEDSITICTRRTWRTILPKFFKTIFRNTRRKMLRRWRASVLGINRAPLTRSMRFSPA